MEQKEGLEFLTDLDSPMRSGADLLPVPEEPEHKGSQSVTESPGHSHGTEGLGAGPAVLQAGLGLPEVQMSSCSLPWFQDLGCSTKFFLPLSYT